MLETEENYLRMLNVVVNHFKKPLEEYVGQPNEILNTREINVMFSKIPNLIHLHADVSENLRKAIADWRQKSTPLFVGRIWINVILEVKTSYPPYINSYDEAMQTLDMCLATKPAFKHFIKVFLFE